MNPAKLLTRCLAKPGKKFRLKDHDPEWGAKLGSEEKLKSKSRAFLEKAGGEMSHMQELLYAADRWSVLLVFQAMDAAGKDGTIRHVMHGVNPQGCQVFSFKQPSSEELDHNFLWRYTKALPERGRIGIFNRSYYEEVLVVRVHPEWVGSQKIPGARPDKQFWKARFDDINALENHLARNGTLVLKFFLNVSKKEQKKRFLDRLNDPHKNWKYSAADLRERGYWKDYMKAYEEMIAATSTKWAPWHIIPADNKWAARALVGGVIVDAIKGLKLKYPTVSTEMKKEIEEAKKKLEAER